MYDFIDPNILHMVEELEREKGLRYEEGGDDDFDINGTELTP